MFSSQAFATATRLNPSIDLLAESKNILAIPTSLRAVSYTHLTLPTICSV